MKLAPDAFEIADGIYTPTYAVEWVATQGRPAPLWIGQTLRLDAAGSWTVVTGNEEEKSIEDAGKILPAAFKAAWDGEAEPGLYELVGPKIPTFGRRGSANPHGLSDPELKRHGHVEAHELHEFSFLARNLWWLAAWMRESDYLGVLWTHGRVEGTEYAAVRKQFMPR